MESMLDASTRTREGELKLLIYERPLIHFNRIGEHKTYSFLFPLALTHSQLIRSRLPVSHAIRRFPQIAFRHVIH